MKNIILIFIIIINFSNCSFLETPRKNCQDKIDYNNVDAEECKNAVLGSYFYLLTENSANARQGKPLISDSNVKEGINALLIICLRNALNERNCNKKSDNVFRIK